MAMEQDLARQILDLLRLKGGQKAADLAVTLGVDRRSINQCLTHNLAGQARQDAAYRWTLRENLPARTAVRPHEAGGNVSEIAKVCRYYLDCLGEDCDQGVSEFAASNHGEPGYAALEAHPLIAGRPDWWNAPGAATVFSKVKADRANLTAWLGYPVRLRFHQTPRWRGFFVEPVMLWPIELPENPGDAYRLIDDFPQFNFAFLKSLAMGDPSLILEEAMRLADDLGLNQSFAERPELDELIDRLVSIRQDWDWREEIHPEGCPESPSLAEIDQPGIYNRAVIIPGKRSPYTRGLELELKQLAEIDEGRLRETALGRWMTGVVQGGDTPDSQPLIEVLPMNQEQRLAVRSALSANHTVITGPPGTGKSQVVTNLLVNAAWRGMTVLFASRNHQAVSVVEERVNGLGNRPVLLRLGSQEQEARLASYMSAMLSGQITEDDHLSYQEGLRKHRDLAEEMVQVDLVQAATLEARNRVDQLESEAEAARTALASDRLKNLDREILAMTESRIRTLRSAVESLDPARLGFWGRLALTFSRKAKLRDLVIWGADLDPIASQVDEPILAVGDTPDLDAICQWSDRLGAKVLLAQQFLAYEEALNSLLQATSFEQIALVRQRLIREIASNSSALWRDWVNLAPSRLTLEQRNEIAAYAAVLGLINGSEGQNVNNEVKRKARELRRKVSKFFSCWGITSLSAWGRVPFEHGQFDLVVIDEASQCDIASALPLLFRGKRSVIIGDPQQLRHISALSRKKDGDLLVNHGLLETRLSWAYSERSLYDVAASVAAPESIINLRDHHRSHADIIEFSNKAFYEGRLRVATRYDSLNRPRASDPGVLWTDVTGDVIRPRDGGAENREEAQKVVEILHDLVVVRGYRGSVAVVTPFKAQASLIQTLVNSHPAGEKIAEISKLLIDTIHKFQGDERDVMVFSPVVSGGMPDGGMIFLRRNGNLFNVAITRARGLLHVVGDRQAALSSGVSYLADFADYTSRLLQRGSPSETRDSPTLGAEYPAVMNPERVSEWERIFYRALHAAGVRPIPQYSVEQYDLDFAVFAGDHRLNVEVDGERYHRTWTGELCHRDQLRNQRLIELGWEVKRFWVYEIRDRLEECVEFVKDWVGEPG
jgi:very-short-patch-repair endonuclease